MFLWVALGGVALIVISLVFDDLLEGILPESDWISGPAVGAFAAAFGIVGWVAQASFDAPVGVAAAAGAAAGVGLAAFTARFARALMRMPTDTTPHVSSVVGREGRVITAIRGHGLGEVLVPFAGQSVKFSATAPSDLAVGTAVTVVAVESPTKVRVEPTAEFWR